VKIVQGESSSNNGQENKLKVNSSLAY
jgi:hypothetical protein